MADKCSRCNRFLGWIDRMTVECEEYGSTELVLNEEECRHFDEEDEE